MDHMAPQSMNVLLGVFDSVLALFLTKIPQKNIFYDDKTPLNHQFYDFDG